MYEDPIYNATMMDTSPFWDHVIHSLSTIKAPSANHVTKYPIRNPNIPKKMLIMTKISPEICNPPKTYDGDIAMNMNKSSTTAVNTIRVNARLARVVCRVVVLQLTCIVFRAVVLLLFILMAISPSYVLGGLHISGDIFVMISIFFGIFGFLMGYLVTWLAK
ncbi:hypothetical protein POM88_021823 [Heracleum sosnowskyi]|uniref:Uncharacterized protein n=1 Tax=Heracleum sosnowskyi TaxID=360622 RepID=A0AAD8IGL6_9APIA|nr:hypothetical protein POM88_021823 [Heracleum sosnowskyi]